MESTKPELPNQQNDPYYHQQTHCPSCGRFVGVFDRCPYCQALTQKRMSIRVFKVISLLTSTVGLAMLLFFAQKVKTPEVTIGSLGPLSNFAHVRLSGEVEKSYGIHKDWHSLAFTLRQPKEGGGFNSIRISAYSKVALDIEKANTIPQDGDMVSVEGTVRFQKDSPSLLINAPQHLQIVKKADEKSGAEPVEPAKIDKSSIGKKVVLQGIVSDTKSFQRGTIVRVDNGDDGLVVWVPSQVADEVVDSLKKGDKIEAIGKVKPFKDGLEVEVTIDKGIAKLEAGSGVSASASGGTQTPAATAAPSATPLPPSASPEPVSIQTPVQAPPQNPANPGTASETGAK